MARKKPHVVVTRKLPDVVETRMRELFEAKLNESDRPLSQAELVEAVRHADVLVPTITDRIDTAVLSQAGPNLRLIANFGNGVDNIDVETAVARGITVTNTPGVLTEDTADMTMALMLAVPRRLADGIRAVHDNAWGGWSPTWMLGRRISGKRLGIVGMGRIGQAVARRARAFGMSIHYHNRRRLGAAIEDGLEATWWESLDQMLARMDVVSIHTPHTPATFHLLSARRLEADAAGGLHRQHRPRRAHRRGGPDPPARDGRDGRCRPRRLRARAGDQSETDEARRIRPRRSSSPTSARPPSRAASTWARR